MVVPESFNTPNAHETPAEIWSKAAARGAVVDREAVSSGTVVDRGAVSSGTGGLW